MRYLIKQATILNKLSKHHGKKRDLLIADGKIEKIATNIDDKKAKVLQHKNQYVSAGFCELFADFAEPGYEEHETLQSGMQAACAGGYTDVCLVPDVKPVTQTKAQIEFIKNKSGIVTLHPLGCISQQQEGTHLAEMYDMFSAGAIAFSDGRKPVQHAGLLLKALQYVKSFNGLIIEMPDEKSLSAHGLMHEGIISTSLGMQGKPALAESLAIQQCIELLEYTNSRIHLTGISSKEGIEKIKLAKRKKLNLTCSVNIHHLLFTDEDLQGYDSVFKINPPLRSKKDKEALIKALEEGVIDVITTQHTPCNWDSKNKEFEYAKQGMIGLQQMLSLLLKVETSLKLEDWIELITSSPRTILSLQNPNIVEQEMANLTVFSTEAMWPFNAETNKSLSDNSPMYNQNLTGKVLAVFNKGEAVMYE